MDRESAEQWNASHLTVRRGTFRIRNGLSLLARYVMQNHAKETLTHQLLSYIASSGDEPGRKPKLTIVRSGQ